MTKRTGILCALMLAALFLIVNRAAYRGYFQDDELDNLDWAPKVELQTFIEHALSPRFDDNNFRPVGHFYFHELSQPFGLDFPKYVAVLQAMHLFNVWLLWLLARRLGAPPLAAFLACIFFALHMALFDDFWKPMYVFDVLCGTFCLAALLFWTHRQWVLSFAAFWLAYKSKEMAVMLPLVLLCYEFWLGKRRWKPLIPFFAASLSFGLQGLILNPNQNNDYTFRFSFDALRRTSVSYAGRVFLVPYLGFLAPLAAIPGRNRRVWFGLAMAAILFFPILFLPGRMFSAYCYVPFLGLAVALSGVAEAVGVWPVVIFLLLFTPLNLRELRARRNVTLALDNDIRGWVAGLHDFAGTHPEFDGVVWSGEIKGFASWGMRSAAEILLHREHLKMESSVSDAGRQMLKEGKIAVIAWSSGAHRSVMSLHIPNAVDSPFLDFREPSSVWQLKEGWYEGEGGYRWTAPESLAQLLRPPDARHFALRVLVNPERLRAVGPVTVRVRVGDADLTPRTISTAGPRTLTWELPPAAAGIVPVRLQAAPPFHPPNEGRILGVAVESFGFRP